MTKSATACWEHQSFHWFSLHGLRWCLNEGRTLLSPHWCVLVSRGVFAACNEHIV